VKPRFTRILPLFLLLLAGTPYFYFLIQEIRQKQIQHEMKERLEEEQLQTITINKSSFHWEEKGKEAWINGKLFDVKSIKESGDSVLLTGLFDEQETALVKNLFRQQHKENNGDNKLLTGFFHLFHFTHPGLQLPETSFKSLPREFASYCTDYHSRQPKVNAPPPRG
jgi:hypothetical protein